MPRFFVESVNGDKVIISGNDGNHISRSLRMHPGDSLTLCDGAGYDYTCVIERITDDLVELNVTEKSRTLSEPDVFLTLYQGLPKSDKMDMIVQKAVELGASAIVPTMTARCVSRPDEKSAKKKRERWEKIAQEAAKQCGRGILPSVLPLKSFSEALREACAKGPVLFFYEGGGASLSAVLKEHPGKYLSVFIGPEGGFALEEVEMAQKANVSFSTLGPRILRTETAPLAAITAVMLLTENME